MQSLVRIVVLGGIIILAKVDQGFTQTIKVVSGNDQKVARAGDDIPGGRARFAPLVVQVADPAGKPLPGVKVTWSVKAPGDMACQSELSGAAPTTTITDADGKATLDKMDGNSIHAYYASGQFTMTPSYGNAKVTFALTVLNSSSK